MRAVRAHEFGNPDVMNVEEIPDPRPTSRQVLVRIEAAGVNPVDTYIRSGEYAIRPELPWIPGLDAAGVVEEAGSGVDRVRPGDRVYIAGESSGTYAALAVCDEASVHPLPETVSFAKGAAMGVPYGTAWYALFQRARALPGEIVLVHGASGGVGTAAVQLAGASGMHVIGTAGTERGLALVESLGAHHVLDHRKPGHLDAVRELTADHGIDVVVELRADLNLMKDLGVLAQRGRVVIVGSRGTLEVDPRAAMRTNASVLGMILFNATDEEHRMMHTSLVAGLENGTLDPVIGREFPLSEAPEAHEAIMTPGAYGKILLVP